MAETGRVQEDRLVDCVQTTVAMTMMMMMMMMVVMMMMMMMMMMTTTTCRAGYVHAATACSLHGRLK